jgi:GTPase SAR1 family protein
MENTGAVVGLRAKHKIVFLGDPAVGKTSIIN